VAEAASSAGYRRPVRAGAEHSLGHWDRFCRDGWRSPRHVDTERPPLSRGALLATKRRRSNGSGRAGSGPRRAMGSRPGATDSRTSTGASSFHVRRQRARCEHLARQRRGTIESASPHSTTVTDSSSDACEIEIVARPVVRGRYASTGRWYATRQRCTRALTNVGRQPSPSTPRPRRSLASTSSCRRRDAGEEEEIAPGSSCAAIAGPRARAFSSAVAMTYSVHSAAALRYAGRRQHRHRLTVRHFGRTATQRRVIGREQSPSTPRLHL